MNDPEKRPSFPFLALAKEFGLDYGAVLLHLHWFRSTPEKHRHHCKCNLQLRHMMVVESAWRLEASARDLIEDKYANQSKG